jgi:hypothetical protein
VRKVFLSIAAAVAVASSVVAVRAATSHPDSRTESLEDGCNRSQLALLAEAELTKDAKPHPTGFASWVYVHGDSTPQTLEGSVVGTHTAGTDLFGVHDTYDVNFDVVPDPGYEHLLSTRNAQEEPAGVGQIHTEWESGLAPLFAWPAAGDRVRETGSWIWDCGHWQDGESTTVGGQQVPGQDFVPGDPLGSAGDVVEEPDLRDAGIEPAEGEEIEIHPIMELATWRAHGDFTPRGERDAVHANELDVALSNQGGKAKGVEECALLAPKHPDAVLERLANDGTCSMVQPLAGRDYRYTLSAPGARPSPSSHLVVQRDVVLSHNAPGEADIDVVIGDDAATITIPFSKVDATDDVQDLGVVFHAWWSHDPTPVHRLRVTQTGIHIFNNLDGDAGDTNGNPSVDSDGEWNMYTDIAGRWWNLHDPRDGQTDLAPTLGTVPSAADKPVDIALAGVGNDVVLGDDDTLDLFVDARECDQPGYIDCPTEHDGVGELATTGASAGRTGIRLPVSQLLGGTTTVELHPVVCGEGFGSCHGEQDNAVTRCGPTACYSVTFTIEDLDAGGGRPDWVTVRGDGTGGGTLVGSVAARSLRWWLEPPTRYAPDEGEEYEHVATVINGLRAARR